MRNQNVIKNMKLQKRKKMRIMRKTIKRKQADEKFIIILS